MNLTPTYQTEHRTIITRFIANKLREAGASGVVLGLSGGLDSAVTAALACEALGAERVHGVMMPYEPGTEQESVRHAELVAAQFGFPCTLRPITGQVDGVLGMGGLALQTAPSQIQNPGDPARERSQCRSWDWSPARSRTTTITGNVRSRVRMVILYHLANLGNLLVLGTSNKSELMVGYFTKYGDGASDAMPMGDLYKTQVYALARDLEIPDVILKKPPSAGFAPGQTDEAELGITYGELDRILMGLERLLPHGDIAELTGCDPSVVRRVHHLVRTSAHKRYPGIIPKIGLRTPGYDWRESVSLLALPHEPPG